MDKMLTQDAPEEIVHGSIQGTVRIHQLAGPPHILPPTNLNTNRNHSNTDPNCFHLAHPDSDSQSVPVPKKKYTNLGKTLDPTRVDGNHQTSIKYVP